MATTRIGSVYDLRAGIEEKRSAADVKVDTLDGATLPSKRKINLALDAQVCDLRSESNNPSRAEYRDDRSHQGLCMECGVRTHPRVKSEASALLGAAVLGVTSAFPFDDEMALSCKNYTKPSGGTINSEKNQILLLPPPRVQRRLHRRGHRAVQHHGTRL